MKTFKTLTVMATAFVLSFFMQTSTLQAAGGPHIEIGFTKWVTTSPNMEGFSDIGPFQGVVLNRTEVAGGQIWKIDAAYQFIAGDHTFTAVIHGKHSWHTGVGVLNGVITDGWLAGSQVHVRFVAVPSAEHGVEFTGTITIMPN